MSFAYEIGVVIPVYNSEHSVGAVVEGLLAHFAASGLSGRVVLVDDASTDGSAAAVDRLARENPCVLAAHLARNRGQQSALLCGLRLAPDCRYLVTMDDDLQHPAEVLGALYRKALEGYDLVYAIPRGEKRPLYRRLGSFSRDLLFALCTRKPRGVRVGSYRILTAALAQKICAERQPFVYLSASAFRYAPKTANIPFTPRPRAYGASGYSLGRLLRVYGKLLLYYGPPGLPPRAKRAGPAYQISHLCKGGMRYGAPDDPGRVELPEECPGRRQTAGA